MSNDLDNEVLRLWSEKLSASEIGSILGITKNAVIGRVNRMRKRGLDVETRAAPRLRLAKIPLLAIPIEEEPEPEPENQIGIPFGRLTSRTCKYVIDGDHPRHFRFCGDVVTTKSYCETHHALCYVKPVPRRHRYTDTVFVLKARS